MTEKIPHEAIDAIDLRIGIEKGKSTHERVVELYEVNRAFKYNEIDEATFKQRIDDWWMRGLDVYFEVST